MMAESMIERIGEAIGQVALITPGVHRLKVGRAAIKAMWEPTEGSIAAGVSFLIDANLDGPDGIGESDARGCWQAMCAKMLEDA